MIFVADYGEMWYSFIGELPIIKKARLKIEKIGFGGVENRICPDQNKKKGILSGDNSVGNPTKGKKAYISRGEKSKVSRLK